MAGMRSYLPRMMPLILLGALLLLAHADALQKGQGAWQNRRLMQGDTESVSWIPHNMMPCPLSNASQQQCFPANYSNSLCQWLLAWKYLIDAVSRTSGHLC